MRNIAVIIFAAVLLAACCHDTDRRLKCAAALTDTRPDSALAVLEQIDAGSLATRRQRATYALLCTEARIRCGYHDTGDSLISVASDYFEANGSAAEAARALYCKARVLFEADDYRRAVVELLAAEEMSEMSGDAFMKGKINELFAEIYHLSCNLAEAIPYREKAVRYFRECGRHDLYRYSVIDLATACLDYGDYQKGIRLLVNADLTGGDSAFICSRGLTLMMLLDASGHHKEALDEFHSAQRHMTCKTRPFVNYGKVALVYLNNNMADSARFYLDLGADREEITAQSDGHLLEVRRQYYEQTGKTDSAYADLKRHFKIYNDRAGVVLNQSVALSERDYYSRKSQRERAAAEKNRHLVVALICLASAATVGVIVYYRRRIVREKSRFSEQMADVRIMLDEIRNQKDTMAGEIARLSNSNDEATARLIRQNELVEALFNDNFRSLDNICDEYFEFKDSDRAQIALMNRFRKEIAQLKDDSSFNRLESFVDSCRDNIIGRIRRQMPRFKETDIRILTLVMAGFSPRTICLLCDITLGNYYNKRTRLRARIAASDAPDKELFLDQLS